jgi:tetratricopeptide (TPR) repeat protein
MTTAEEERRLIEHLHRAGELLRADKLEAAEREIAGALALRKDDLRARNLRGLLLFRAARYDEARAVYLELGHLHPTDTALRLNLGLVELRMGLHAEAAANLEKVVAVEPDNARAQGYLGVALMRLGELRSAHAALSKAGQVELAQQVEAKLSERNGNSSRSQLREAAHAGSAALEEEQPFAPVELETPLDEAQRGGAWQLRLAGEGLPVPGPEGTGSTSRLHLRPAMPVAAFATARLLQPGGPGEPFLLSETGMLVMRVDGRLPTRTSGAVASTGQLAFEPLTRRIRAQSSEEPFGEGAEAMFVAVGRGRMVVAARGARFALLALSDDIVYMRESAIYAFEESLAWESGRVPGGGPDAVRVVQFRGSGRLVVRTARAPYTLKIEPDAPLFVDHTTLLGWIGRVVPRQPHGDGGQPSPYIECSGEGVLIIEEPPTL